MRVTIGPGEGWNAESGKYRIMVRAIADTLERKGVTVEQMKDLAMTLPATMRPAYEEGADINTR